MPLMKKALLATAALVVVLPASAFLGAAFFLAQRADYGWSPGLAAPTFATSHPRIRIDEAHHNASSAGFTGRYWPFARLLRADGYAVERCREPFTPGSLDGVQVLVVANAAGTAKTQVFGINIPFPAGGGHGERGDPAFTPEEIATVHAWVEDGGSLLLIADHAPFGAASEALAAAFGVTMHKGFVEVPGESSDPLLFAADNGRLGDHPIVRGDGRAPGLRRVMTYTGQSLDAPRGATALLRLPASAVEAVPEGEDLATRPAGPAQAVALEAGKGRVVVLGEAAMVTAQVAGRVPYGMNTGDNDNRQFVLNTMHWLSRIL